VRLVDALDVAFVLELRRRDLFFRGANRLLGEVEPRLE
jgi:hypothetical protein